MIHEKRSARNLAVAVVIGVLVLAPHIASATGYYVTTYDDSMQVDGKCSLREAIKAVNTRTAVDTCPAASGVYDSIYLPKGTYYPKSEIVVGDWGQKQKLTIYGAGPNATIIDGSQTASKNMFSTYVPVEISNLSIQNSLVGVLTAHSELTIRGCLIKNNTTGYWWIIMNSSYDYGKPLKIINSTITGNKVRGAIVRSWGSLAVTGSTISENIGNSAIAAGHWDGPTTLKLINATIANNEAVGLELANSGDKAARFLSNSIIAQNEKDGLRFDCDDHEVRVPPIQVEGLNIIERPGNCKFSDPTKVLNVDPMLGDLKYYRPLMSYYPPSSMWGWPQGEMLLPTHALLTGSPAIDAVPACSGAGPWDERFVSRPQDGDGDGVAKCDIGAVEMTPEEVDDQNLEMCAPQVW